MLRFLFLILFLNLFQLTNGAADTLRFVPALERMKVIGDTMLRSRNDSSRIAAEGEFQHMADSILSQTDGNLLSFYQVKAMSLVSSEDQHLKLYNWMLMLENGMRYRFSGIALARSDRKQPYRKYLLEEKTFSDIEGAALQKLDHTTWPPCIYYSIISKKYKKKTHYIALGWAPQSHLTTRKIIEPVVITPTKLIFGAPVIKAKGKKTRHRLVFEYNARATMSLRYEPSAGMIVFDHLAPSDPRPESKGIYSLYGPDLSYDGLEFSKGSWILKEDIDVKNSGLNQGKEGKFFK
jgi:hypothetical protein